MIEPEAPGGTSRVSSRRGLALRVVAAAGAAVAAWIAADSFAANVVRSGVPGGSEFFLFWGVPFAAAAAFLAWFAALGSRPAVREAARSGCLAALLLGGTVFIVLFASPLFLRWDALRGAVAAFLYAPFAATVGLALGLATRRVRRRGD